MGDQEVGGGNKKTVEGMCDENDGDGADDDDDDADNDNDEDEDEDEDDNDDNDVDDAGTVSRAEITKLREELGAMVRVEQVERERRRREDGSGMRDG